MATQIECRIKIYESKNNVEWKKKSAKSLKKTTDEDDEKILYIIKLNTQTNPCKVKNELKLTLSSKTISRRLAEEEKSIIYQNIKYILVKKIRERD